MGYSRSHKRRCEFMKILLLALFLSLQVSCANAENEPMPTPYLPTQAKPVPDRMMAELEGDLVLVDGCIRVKSYYDGEETYPRLLIWPYGFRLEIEDEVVRVRDDIGRVVGIVGEPIYMGGGEITGWFADDLVGEPILDFCPTPPDGPYWLVGDVYELVLE